ncbi:MAG: universal stress protein [Proteobacteria bacterium]|nr:universal stress protein [Pseudomonadota bacterium]MDA1071315.1 universal stress protein [Pseudomonadota bacterium]
MSIAKILVAASGTVEGRAALETAFLLAKRFNAHVEAINVRRNPRDAVAFMTEGMTGAVIEEIIATAEQDIERRAHKAEDDLHAVAERHGVPITSHPLAGELSVTFRVDEGREDEVIAERGRMCDLVIAARPTADGDAKEEVVAESVLMESGSGLLLVPSGSVTDLSGNAAIAWNGSAEAARAVHRAMPLLVQAKEVAIMAPEEGSMRGPGPEALAAYLALHGIHCHVHNLPSNWTHIGDVLLEVAHQEKAAFIVMGAFSQGKLRQLILGGATRFMLNHADLPVLFTH